MSAQIMLVGLFIGAGLIANGVDPLHAIQSENYPAGGQVEIINDFQPPQDINPGLQQGGDGYNLPVSSALDSPKPLKMVPMI